MKKKIIGDGVPPQCAYCVYGTASADSATVLCVKQGVLDKSASCKKFRYDPLKREPKPAPELLAFTADDFSLD